MAFARLVCGLMLTLLLVSVLEFQPAGAEPKTWTVDDDGSADFRTIQEAVNAASMGDSVYVYTGVYRENVVVNKTAILNGQDRSATVIDGGDGFAAVQVDADHVEIGSFTIRNGSYGVLVEVGSRSTIRSNVVTACDYGVVVKTSGNVVSDNIVLNNSQSGILVIRSMNSVLANNLVTGNGMYGIFITESSGNVLRNNSMAGNAYDFGVYGEDYGPLSYYVQDVDPSNFVNGKPIYYLVDQRNMVVPSDAGFVALVDSENITVKNLSLTGNEYGTLMAYSNNSLVTGNSFSYNSYGLYLIHSSRNRIDDNVVSDNVCGIFNDKYSSGNNITENTIVRNSGYGILFHGPGDERNRIVNNLIANSTLGIHFGGYSHYNKISQNIIRYCHTGVSIDWSQYVTISENNITANKQGLVFFMLTGPNLVFHNNFVGNDWQASTETLELWDNGYPSGGNYWSDYSGVDSNHDGIGDTPYVINAQNRDNYPLIRLWGPHARMDVNGDGSINVLDLIVIAQALGAHPGDPKWNPRADAKEDNVVNVLDLILVAKYLGT